MMACFAYHLGCRCASYAAGYLFLVYGKLLVNDLLGGNDSFEK